MSALTMSNGNPTQSQSQTKNTHQVVFKSIGTYATNVHYHHVRIPVPIGNFTETPKKAMKLIEKYTHNIYTNSLTYFKMDPRNYQVPDVVAQEAAILTQNQNMFVYNNSMSELQEIYEDMRSVTSTLPTEQDRDKRQIGLLFGIGSAIFASKNFLSIQKLERENQIEKGQIKAITHILEIDRDHFKHLDIESQTNRYLAMQQLQFNPVLLESSAQNIVFRTLRIADKVMGAVQQLQIHRLSTNLLRGSTVTAIFKEMQHKADFNKMELLLNSPADLFKIEVSYFYKPETQEINMFLHVPMVKPEKLLKFFKFIKFPLTQADSTNFSMIPHMDSELLAVGQNHQYKILSQADLIDCEHLGATFLCKGRDVLRSDLEETCLGSYYLENKTAILEKCTFDFKKAEEQVFQISPSNWLVSSPVEYSARVICDTSFKTVKITTSTMIQVLPGCSVNLKTHTIDPDTHSLEVDSEAIHYEWAWEMKDLFPNSHLKEFSDTVQDLKNTTDVSLSFLQSAVQLHSGLNKRLENKLATHHDEIFKSVDSYLDDIKKGEEELEENIAHPNILLYVIISACVLGLLFFIFKIFCTSTHSRKPLFPSYRMREWTKRHRFLDPIGSRSVSLDQGLEMQVNGVNRIPQGGVPLVIPAYHKV